MTTTAVNTVSTATLTDPDAVRGIDHNPADALYPDWRGINYVGGRDITDVARIVRTEVRKAIKTGTLAPVTKVSVRIERYSMGHAVRVKLTVPRIYVGEDTPGAVLSEDRWGDRTWIVPVRGVGVYETRILPDVRDARDRVTAFLATFNYNRSNVMIDYFDTGFHSSVDVGEGS